MRKKKPTAQERRRFGHFEWGRPRKFKSVKEVEEAIESYFVECNKKLRHYTVTGLALWLGCDRETVTDYESGKQDIELENGIILDFSVTFRKAKARILHYKEQLLLDKGNPSGVIFDLKNNSSRYYKDKVEIEGTIKVGVSLCQLTNGQETKPLLA